MKLFICNLLFIFIHHTYESNNICTGRNAISQPVIDYCTSKNGSLESRCCFSSNSTSILAIDLTNMDLNRVPNSIEFENLTNVTVMDLRLNPQLKYIAADDFLDMKYLDQLYLPEQYQCPGGQRIWEVMNQTTDLKGFACMHQKDICKYLNGTCPVSTSSCASNGPNHFLCLCKPGYYGYKCLRHGKFPVGTFFGAALAITAVLSVFCYLAQRRNVKKD